MLMRKDCRVTQCISCRVIMMIGNCSHVVSFPIHSRRRRLYNFTFEHKGVQFVFLDWGHGSYPKQCFCRRRVNFSLKHYNLDCRL